VFDGVFGVIFGGSVSGDQSSISFELTVGSGVEDSCGAFINIVDVTAEVGLSVDVEGEVFTIRVWVFISPNIIVIVSGSIHDFTVVLNT
jgi:hypothetical protein